MRHTKMFDGPVRTLLAIALMLVANAALAAGPACVTFNGRQNGPVVDSLECQLKVERLQGRILQERLRQLRLMQQYCRQTFDPRCGAYGYRPGWQGYYPGQYPPGAGVGLFFREFHHLFGHHHRHHWYHRH